MKPITVCIVSVGGSRELILGRVKKRLRIARQLGQVGLLTDASREAEPQFIESGASSVSYSTSEGQSEGEALSGMSRILRQVRVIARMCSIILRGLMPSRFYVFSSGVPLVLPLIVCAKIVGGRTLVLVGGSAYLQHTTAFPSRRFLSSTIRCAETTCYFLVDHIAVETPAALRFMGLEALRPKVSFLGSLSFVDTDLFFIDKDFEKRKYAVGFVGAMDEGKGVLDFVRSLPMFLARNPDSRAILVGSGKLTAEVHSTLREMGLDKRVSVQGWLPQDEVPSLLNDIRVLVLPSKSEGLPNIILEAMACGTIVVASGVGGIPDVIENGKSGFIIRDAAPSRLADLMEYALKSSNAHTIVHTARGIVETQFSFKAAVDNWKEMLDSI